MRIRSKTGEKLINQFLKRLVLTLILYLLFLHSIILPPDGALGIGQTGSVRGVGGVGGVGGW
ncbi:hypothetical protein NSTC745_01667 [Nostoc sp. DSM 114161]|jgi:hypothetical protein|uniref:hypothetical protein n=1 Tax=Nostoc sp. DSM 114161 TaxID=3440143 RepID=UPI004045AFED